MFTRFWMAACVCAGLACLAQTSQAPYQSTILAGTGPANGAAATAVGLYDVSGTAVDSAGNLYFTSTAQSRIYRISAQGTLSVIAGTGTAGFLGDNGPAVNAQLNSPAAIAVDGSGNVYFADVTNQRIRKIGTDGWISTVAGTGEAALQVSGPARQTGVGQVRALAVDSAGNLYFSSGYDIRKVSNGMITRIAGTGDAGFSGDNGPADSARIGAISDLAVDGAGNVYLHDANNNRIRKVSGGVITTVAGNGLYDTNAPDGSNATSVGVGGISALAVDTAGNIFIGLQNRVRKVSGGVLTTVAGNGSVGAPGSSTSASGNGGSATAAALGFVSRISVDTTGALYVTEAPGPGRRIRKVAGGIISAFAGNGTYATSGDGGPALTSQTAGIRSLAADPTGNLYLADVDANLVRKISGGTITTIAGGGTGPFFDGATATAPSILPGSVAADGSGNVYIADWATKQIGKISQGKLLRVAGTGTAGYSGDGGPAANATIGDTVRLAADAAGALYLADQNRIRKITAGNISLLAGAGPLDGVAGKSLSVDPAGVASDTAGNLYVAARFQHKILKIAPDGTVSTVAGNGTAGYSGDGGPATAAQLNYPTGVAVDSQGAVYVSDSNLRIRKISGGIITSVIGGGSGCPQQTNTYGDGCTGPSAILSTAGPIAFDTSGTLYFGDGYRVRKLSGGIVTIAAGTLGPGISPDGTAATSARFSTIGGLAVDASGNIFVADTFNHRVRKVAANVVTTVAGNGDVTYPGDGAAATGVGMTPTAVAVDASGKLYIADSASSTVRKVSAGIISTLAGGGFLDATYENVGATDVVLMTPSAVTTDAAGNVYIGDTGQYRVRKVLASGIIVNLAGNGYRSSSGDNGPALRAQFDSPTSIAVDTTGTLYVAESRRVRAISGSGTVTTVYESAGNPANGGGPTAVAADGTGNVFVADATQPAQIYRLSGGTAVPFTPITTTSSFGSFNYGNGGLASDGKGTLYMADGSGIVRAFAPVTGGTCNFAVRFDPAPVLPAAGGPVTLQVDTTPGCSWGTSPTVDWLASTNPPTGVGPGTWTLVARANVSTSPRSATVTIGNRSFTITQSGTGCTLTLSTNAITPPASGATGAIQITSGCSWTGSSSADWIQFFPLNGTGNATTYYTILPNFGTSSRYGTLSINGNSVTVTQPGATGAFRNRFVRLLYYYMLGRMPTQAEEDFQVANGGSTLDLAKAFFTSEEFANTGKMVASLYVGLLGRDAEYGGWIFQRNALRSGQFDAVGLIQNFITAQEFGLRWGTLTDNQFVRLLYQNMLGRLPSQAEEDWQAGNVKTLGRARIAANFTLGAEFRIGRLAQFDSFLAYASLLSRDPSEGERKTTRARLESGVSIDTILSEIVNSPEFATLLQ